MVLGTAITGRYGVPAAAAESGAGVHVTYLHYGIK
jgi:hypothetical protein